MYESVQLFLLTHEREVYKASNSGRVVLATLPQDCTRIIWQRRQADPRLLAALENKTLALLHPDGEPIESWASDQQQYVCIDATWQHAAKIYRQSAYLQQLPRVSLPPGQVSNFKRRRNQRAGGLCTAEAIACLLRTKGLTDKADRLDAAFARFNTQKPADNLLALDTKPSEQ